MIKKENGDIDFQEWNVPTSWKQMNLRQYQDIQRLYSNKDEEGKPKVDIRDILAIAANKSRDEVNELPLVFLEALLEKLSFLQEQPTFGKPRNYVTIGGKTYSINTFERMKTGEYISLDNILKNDKYDYSSVLAVLCRRDGERYDSKFEAEKFDERRKMYEGMSVEELFPLVGFFLKLFALRNQHFLLYSLAEEELNRIQTSIDNSQEIGAFRRYSLNSQIKNLRKSLESNKII